MNTRRKLDIFDTRFHNPSIYAVRAQTSHAGTIIDFCVPANSYFPPDALLTSIREELPDILKYYPDYAPVHQKHLANLVDIPADNIVAANGITELITILCRDASGPIVTDTPTFGRWTDLPLQYGVPVHFLQRQKQDQFQLSVDQIVNMVRETAARTLVLCNPNNPTGACLSAVEVVELTTQLHDLEMVIIDESFIDFSAVDSAQPLAVDSSNVVVVKSLGKALGWHGMRLGYSVSNARHAATLRSKVPYWNINGLAAFVLKQVGNYKKEYFESFKKVARDRDYMLQALKQVQGLTTYPSGANFLMSELPAGASGKVVRDALLERHGLLVRECSNKLGSSESFLRNVVRTQRDVDHLISALHAVLAEASSEPG